ncbi:histidine kinase [Ferruginibacter paludis]|uniref:sensor histidine kinase n=1 Tax=Ferruginibacter paludis TaxID=1310417 RepID=UPI0025B4C211|nr:histidine kinase [Ferruginibacter paludis]MDN3655817.1 histidine kinase [Ferruginibacter paludis]
MSASFKGWGKGVIVALLILAFHVTATAQNEKLWPELDVTNGLQSNTVRCIKIDGKGRFWIGTDYGLDIHNANSIAQKKIIEAIQHKSIQAIEFLDSLVFIGTSYEGLYIFNQLTGNLHKYYGPASIPQIRKLKIFGKQVFILSDTGPYLWTFNSLRQIPLTSAINDDYLIDMFQLDNNQYGLAYPSKQIVRFKNGAFEENCNSLFFQNNTKLYAEHYTSSLCFNNKLFLGSGGQLQSLLIVEKGKPPMSLNFLKKLGVGYMVWDIAEQNDKLILAVGDTISNRKGLLCILNPDYTYMSIKAADYITCLALDPVNNILTYGTINNGLFLQSGIGGCSMIDKPTECNIVANDKSVFIYTDDYFQKFSTTDSKSPLNLNSKNKIADIISSMNLCGDTLIYANDNFIKLYNATSLQPLDVLPVNHTVVNNNIAAIERINGTIFYFYRDGGVSKCNLITKKTAVIEHVISHNPMVFKLNNKIILLSKEKGFFAVSEKEGYPLTCTDTSIHFINDFTIGRDTIYALLKDEIRKYKIDYINRRLIFLHSFSTYSTLFDVIGTRWILSKDDKVYILNDNGIMQMNSAMVPVGYYYFGSYNQIKKPIIVGDSLLISTNNYLTKFSFTEFDRPIPTISADDFSIECPKSIFENIGFTVKINLADYFLQDRSFKTLELWSDGKLKATKYSKFSEFNFNDGLNYGDYDLVVKLGNNIARHKLKVTLPLNRNPWFFAAIALAVAIIFSIVIKSNIDKRRLKKRLIENKLQNLKQNLNPHFVYNSMNLISSMILEEKYDEALQVVSDFSRLQRTYLETNNKEQISVAEELAFLDSYLKLQQQRFNEDNDFNYSITCDPAIDITQIMLPPLILQPIAENAIKYGVLASKAPARSIKIEVNIVEKGMVTIALEDNGMEVDLNYHGLGMGQKLVQERIALFNLSHNAQLTVLFDQPAVHSASGYRVELEIPLA